MRLVAVLPLEVGWCGVEVYFSLKICGNALGLLRKDNLAPSRTLRRTSQLFSGYTVISLQFEAWSTEPSFFIELSLDAYFIGINYIILIFKFHTHQHQRMRFQFRTQCNVDDASRWRCVGS